MQNSRSAHSSDRMSQCSDDRVSQRSKESPKSKSLTPQIKLRRS
jgi:hypothetical protein